MVARYGGEEFAVILPESDASSTHKVAEKIRLDIKQRAFNILEGRTIPITTSIGVASLDMFPESGDDDANRIIKLADEALYDAKNSGRNRTVVAKRRY